MSGTQPVIAQKSPYRMEVEAGKSVLVVRLRQERQPAVLRRLAQGQRVLAGRVQGGRIRNNPVLWVQEHRQPAALRRDAS